MKSMEIGSDLPRMKYVEIDGQLDIEDACATLDRSIRSKLDKLIVAQQGGEHGVGVAVVDYQTTPGEVVITVQPKEGSIAQFLFSPNGVLGVIEHENDQVHREMCAVDMEGLTHRSIVNSALSAELDSLPSNAAAIKSAYGVGNSV